MEEIKDYPLLVDAVYKIVRGAPDDQEQIDITFIANALGIPWDSRAGVMGIAGAMEDLVSLGYCNKYEEFDGRYYCISRSPHAPTNLPSERPNPYSIDELLPFRKSALKFIHEKSVCHEFGITFYNRDFSIAVKNALDELLPKSTDMRAAVIELFDSMLGLINSSLLTGIPFPNNISLRPAGLLPNEIDRYIAMGDIFPPNIYLNDPSFLENVITIGVLRLWVTFGGAVCLNRTSSKSF